MYKIGDFVINTNNGICEIKDIVSMNISGSTKKAIRCRQKDDYS